MSHDALEISTPSRSDKAMLGWLLPVSGIWIVGVTLAALNGVFDVPADQPAIPSLLAVTVPVGVFIAAMLASTQLRTAVLELDPVLLTEFQAWRVLGGVFLVVFAFGHLPGVFAWPAGLGDVAVGLVAPIMAWRLRTQPNFLTSSRFRWFQYLGLFDFVVAVSTGIAARNEIPGLMAEITAAPMGQFPLVLIPALVVPAFIILHLIVLMQISAARRR